MTSLKEFQARIDRLAKAKGWSDELHWLELGIFKEAGELVQAMEHYQDIDSHDKGQPEIQDEKSDLLDEITFEFGDVMHFLLQAMHHFNIDLDIALQMTIKRNTHNKKKTIDSNGNIVRR